MRTEDYEFRFDGWSMIARTDFERNARQARKGEATIYEFAGEIYLMDNNGCLYHCLTDEEGRIVDMETLDSEKEENVLEIIGRETN